MYVIALDEKGNFESPDNEEKMVAGLIYCGSEEDIKEERKRIEVYLRMLCDEVNNDLSVNNSDTDTCCYPEDLHLRNSKENGSENRIINGRNVHALKTKMAETISNFLIRGRFRDELISEYQMPENRYIFRILPRKGRYFIYANLCSRNGKEKLLGSHVGKLVKDDFASNLYIHMAEDVISRLLLQTPARRSHQVGKFGST